MEVALTLESNISRNVVGTKKAKMAQGCSLLCCLSDTGGLAFGDISESEALRITLEGTYSE